MNGTVELIASIYLKINGPLFSWHSLWITLFKKYCIFLIIVLCEPFLKSSMNLLQYCFCFIFWPGGMWDLSSLSKDSTCTYCIGRWSFNHWTTREVCTLAFLTFIFIQPVLRDSVQDHKNLLLIVFQNN